MARTPVFAEAEVPSAAAGNISSSNVVHPEAGLHSSGAVASATSAAALHADEVDLECAAPDVSAPDAKEEATASFTEHAACNTQEVSTTCTSSLDDDEDSMDRQKSRRIRRRCVVWSCVLAVLGCIIIAVLLLWPKDPSWVVSDVSISKADVDQMMASMLQPTFNRTAKFPCSATVRFDNYNYVGAQVGEGEFGVFFQGMHIATARNEALNVPARGSSQVKTHTEVSISPEVSKAIMRTVLPSFQMKVDVIGRLPAKAFGISLSIGLKCEVDLNVIAVVTRPVDMIGKHKCKYSY